MNSASRPFMELAEKMLRGEIPPPPVGETVGMRMVEIGTDFAAFEMEAGRRHANPMGTLHGGILCDIADGAMGMAWATGLGDGETFTTLELKINFLKPVWNASLRAEAHVLRRGKTIGMVTCDVCDEKGDIVAHASSTLMTLRGEKARGR